MKIILKQIGKGSHFQGSTEDGYTSTFHVPLNEEKKVAPSPMQILLMCVPACVSVDVQLILSKMKQQLEDVQVEVNGERIERKSAKPFSAIHMHFILKGNVDEKKAKRAIDLAVEKYCSVGESLDKDIEIETSLEVVKR